MEGRIPVTVAVLGTERGKGQVVSTEEGGFRQPRACQPGAKSPRHRGGPSPAHSPQEGHFLQAQGRGSGCFALQAWPERPWVLAKNWVSLAPTPTLPSG